MSVAVLIADDIKYVTDSAGRRKEVIVPYQTWTVITEEIEALREKQDVFFGLQRACREVKAQERGELPEQTLDEFLNEL